MFWNSSSTRQQRTLAKTAQQSAERTGLSGSVEVEGEDKCESGMALGCLGRSCYLPAVSSAQDEVLPGPHGLNRLQFLVEERDGLDHVLALGVTVGSIG